MSKVGISDAAARHLISELGAKTDELQAIKAKMGGDIGELAQVNYRSTTTEAYHNKWESQVGPGFDKIINRSREQQQASTQYFDRQQANLQEGASSILAV